MTSACDWNCVHTSLNPADVGTREGSVKNSDSLELWLRGPSFLLQGVFKPEPVNPAVVVRRTSIDEELLFLKNDTYLEIESAPDLYALKSVWHTLLSLNSLWSLNYKSATFVN